MLRTCQSIPIKLLQLIDMASPPMLLRDQLSAAIRLGLLGPLEGHQLQHDFYAVFEHILAAQAGKGYGEAVRSAFMLDVAQVLHEDIYSKLFQN